MQTHNCKLQFAVFRENSDAKVLRNLVASSFGEKVADLPLAKASLKRFGRSEPVLIETPYIKNLALDFSYFLTCLGIVSCRLYGCRQELSSVL